MMTICAAAHRSYSTPIWETRSPQQPTTDPGRRWCIRNHFWSRAQGARRVTNSTKMMRLLQKSRIANLSTANVPRFTYLVVFTYIRTYSMRKLFKTKNYRYDFPSNWVSERSSLNILENTGSPFQFVILHFKIKLIIQMHLAFNKSTSPRPLSLFCTKQPLAMKFPRLSILSKYFSNNLLTCATQLLWRNEIIEEEKNKEKKLTTRLSKSA